MRLRNKPQAKIFLKNNYQIVIQEPQTYKGDWISKIFNNTQPCHLKIGCGKGDFIMSLSKILCLDNSFWILFRRSRTKNYKKTKNPWYNW